MSKEKPTYATLGSSGLEYSAGYVQEEFLRELRWPWAADIYREMASNDAVVGAILYLAEMLTRKVEWSTKGKTDSAEDTAAAQFLTECMNDMDQSWNDTISEVISMFTYGFSFHEIVYKIRRGPDEKDPKYHSEYTDGKIGWRNLPGRSQHSLVNWEFDERGMATAFVQKGWKNANPVTIPFERGLLFRTTANRNNPEGRSLLRNAYRSWYFKRRIEEIEGIGVERDLAGLPVLEAPEGLDIWNDDIPNVPQIRQNAEALVRGVRRDAEEGVLLPPGWKLTLLSSGSSRQFDTNAIINRYDNRIAITMLSDLVLIGSNSTGSFALAEAKQSMLGLALEAQLENISTTFNKTAVPKLLEMNGMSGKAEIVAGSISSPSIKDIALLLRSMGIDINHDKELINHLRSISDMPEMSEEVFQATLEAIKSANEKSGAVEPPSQDNKNPNDKDFEQNDLSHE